MQTIDGVDQVPVSAPAGSLIGINPVTGAATITTVTPSVNQTITVTATNITTGVDPVSRTFPDTSTVSVTAQGVPVVTSVVETAPDVTTVTHTNVVSGATQTFSVPGVAVVDSVTGVITITTAVTGSFQTVTTIHEGVMTVT